MPGELTTEELERIERNVNAVAGAIGVSAEFLALDPRQALDYLALDATDLSEAAPAEGCSRG